MQGTNEIFETIKMIENQNLDIRTVTMGISLRDCCGENGPDKIYEKITRKAKDLVKICNEIEKEFGVPIINKRVSVTPISIIAESSPNNEPWEFAVAMDKAANEIGIDFIGGYSALIHKGYTNGDHRFISSIPHALSITDKVCCSVNVATSKAGINMDAVKEMGIIIKEAAELTKENNGIACAKLVIFANAPEDNPFMAGAFHGIGEPECVINVGVSGPGVVKVAIEDSNDCSMNEIAEIIKKTAFKITRMGQLVCNEAAKRLGVSSGIVDLSLAPTPAIGDSVANILEEIGLEVCGTHGTTAALALLNDAVKKGGVMASSNVGGLSGAFIPVSEDEGMVRAVEKGALTLEKLEAMTCVCSVGLDMVFVAGDTPASTISGIIADEAALGVVNNKTTGVRIIPVPGKKQGDHIEFGGLLGGGPIMAINKYSCEKMINRGGRIPAPLHSLRN